MPRKVTALFAAATLALGPVQATTGAQPLATQTGPLVSSEEIADAELITLGEDRYNRMTIPVTIEGQGPFDFMIDTGSQATVVTKRLSDRLQLRPLGAATVVGMASTEAVQLVELNGLEFAARVFDNVEAPMLEARHLGADGILGLDSLQDLRVLIDFRKQEIAVADAETLGGNDGYEIVVKARRKLGRLIITNAKIDGVSTAVILDTGAQGSMGNLALQSRLRARRTDTVTTTDVNGNQISGRLGYAKSVRIGRMELSGVPIAFANSPAFAALGLQDKPALVLGMQDLRSFDRVAIDFASRQVLFDLPGSTKHEGKWRRGFFPSRLPS